eukprot:976630_1
MSNDCLFEIAIHGSDWFFDCLWIGGIAVGLTILQILTVAPFIKPAITKSLEWFKEKLSQREPQANNSEYSLRALLDQNTENREELQQQFEIFWKDYQREFDVCGLNFAAYVVILTIACFFVTLGTVFLIYSTDDPRIIWKNEGWKKTINGPTMLIVLIGGSNSMMLRATKKTIESVLVYYKSTKITDAFQLIYWVSLLTPYIFFCIYYPYIVCVLLMTAFTVAICLGIICTCGGCCTLFCLLAVLYWMVDLVFECLLCPFTCCISKEKHQFCKQLLVFSVLYVMVQYGCMVLLLILIYEATGGIGATDVCIHDNVKTWLALLWLQFGPIIGAIGTGYKFCKCIQSNAGTMELKDEYVNESHRSVVPSDQNGGVNRTSDDSTTVVVCNLRRH